MSGTINNSKSSLNNLLQAVLSIVNEDQSAILSPSVYSSMYNTVTSFLLNKCVKLYPDNPMIVDVIDPYVKFCQLPIENGYVCLPDDYRNILGSPYIFANPKNTGPCDCEPEINTAADFQKAKNSAACRVNELQIVSQAEFATRTGSTYNYPTHRRPIAFFSGKKKLKACPPDVAKLNLLYTQQEGIYQLGVLWNPDDTYSFDPSTTVDSLWGDASFEPLLRGILHLYSAYTRDEEIKNFSVLLSQIDIV